MGYELDKLLKQYGVSSAFTPTYTGTAKPAAGEVGPSQYTTDKALFDKYKESYQERMGGTPMYAGAQFQTKPAATSASVDDLYQNYLGRSGETAGEEYWKNKIGSDVSENEIKEFVNAAKPELAGRNFGSQALMDATGSYYGGQLQAPTYANYITPNTVADSGLTLSTTPVTTTGGTSTTPVTTTDVTSTTTAPVTMSTLGTTSSGVPSQSEVTSGGPTSGFSAANYTDVNGAAIPWYLQTANVNLPDAKKAAAVQGITLTMPTLAELATKNEVDASSMPTSGFNAMSFSQPWYMQEANYNLPDAVKARKLAGYSHGGQVKTHYYRGDRVELPDNYDMDGMQLAAIDVADNPMNYTSDEEMRNKAAESTKTLIDKYLSSEPTEIAEAPPLNVQPIAVQSEAVKPTLVVTAPAPAPAEVAPVKPARLTTPGTLNLPPDLAEMLSKYTGGESVYGTELAGARTRAETESKSFNDMLEKALAGTKEEAPSKAEMYFRLAAAFGKPTKTGNFFESLGNVGEVLGEQAKEERAQRKAERALKLQLGLKGQEARMAAAKEDVAALRGLAGEEMKDKRSIATELLKQHIASGEPKSSAGKQAQDEGLKPGTPEFKERVAKISELNIERANTAITSALSGMSVAQANLALQNRKFEAEQEKAAKLTPGELKLKVETEDVVAQTDQALKDLKRAYELNPNTFDSSLVDAAQRKLLESAGSKDDKLIATREQENLLQKAALSQLKSTFPGAISNDERKALQDVQGIGAKSKEERAVIMKNAYNAIKSVNARHRKRVNEINQGLYRDTTPPTGELE